MVPSVCARARARDAQRVVCGSACEPRSRAAEPPLASTVSGQGTVGGSAGGRCLALTVLSFVKATATAANAKRKAFIMMRGLPCVFAEVERVWAGWRGGEEEGHGLG